MPIRPAGPTDAGAIAEILVSSWDATYRGLIPDEVIDRLTVDARTEQWAEAIAAGRTVLLDEDDHGVAGFCSVAPRTAGPDPAGEITALYVAPGRTGQGHGSRLLRSALGWMRERGCGEAVVWVLASNGGARAFYEATGWVSDGAVTVDDSFGAPLEEVRYRTPL